MDRATRRNLAAKHHSRRGGAGAGPHRAKHGPTASRTRQKQQWMREASV